MTIDEQIADAEQHLQRVHDSLRARRELVNLSGRELAEAESRLADLRAEQAAAASAPAKSYGHLEAVNMFRPNCETTYMLLNPRGETIIFRVESEHHGAATTKTFIDSTLAAALDAAHAAGFSAGSAETLAKCEEAVQVALANRGFWDGWGKQCVTAMRAAVDSPSGLPVDRVAEAVAAERERIIQWVRDIWGDRNANYMSSHLPPLVRSDTKGGAA